MVIGLLYKERVLKIGSLGLDVSVQYIACNCRDLVPMVIAGP